MMQFHDSLMRNESVGKFNIPIEIVSGAICWYAPTYGILFVILFRHNYCGQLADPPAQQGKRREVPNRIFGMPKDTGAWICAFENRPCKPGTTR